MTRPHLTRSGLDDLRASVLPRHDGGGGLKDRRGSTVFFSPMRLLVPFAALACALAFAPAATAQIAFVAVRGADTVLVVGSIHALPRDSSALGPYLAAAAERATAFAFEVDLDAYEPIDEALRPRMRLPEGKRLNALLPDSTLRRLRRALPTLDQAEMQRMRPWAVAEAVLAKDPDPRMAGYTPEWGIDHLVLRIAKRRLKPVLGLETVKFQLDTFGGMSWAEELAYLDHALALSGAQSRLPRLVQVWRAGDLAAFEGLVLDPALWPTGLRERMLDRRNAAWLPRIEALMAGQRLLVVVGAAHLVGPNGVPALLRGQGFAVRQAMEAVAPSPVRPPDAKRPRRAKYHDD